MDESDFLPALSEVLRLAPDFGHRQHVHLAWRYLRSAEPSQAEAQMRSAIQHLAAAHGTPEKYHETLTTTWTRLIAAHVRSSDAETFEDFIEANSMLLDKRVPGHFFTEATLTSDLARREWVEPDLRALPLTVR